MTKLYIGNLPWTMSQQGLQDLFAPYGTVASATIIMDRDSGRSKGFGFVELEDDAMAQQAISEMHEKEIEGRKLIVNVARPKEDRPPGGGYNDRR